MVLSATVWPLKLLPVWSNFSKWRTPPSWIFYNSEMLSGGRVNRVNMRHRAKFDGDRSNPYSRLRNWGPPRKGGS